MPNVYNEPGSQAEHFTLQNNVRSDLQTNMNPCQSGIETDTSLMAFKNHLGVYKTIASGAIYITNIVPQDPGDNVSSKVYSSSGIVLDSCLSNTNLITVSVVAIVGHSNFISNATINGTPITLTGSVGSAILTGSININTASATSLFVLHEDGGSHTTTIAYDVGPAITTCEFTGSYPGSQTELKANDVYNLHVVTDINMTRIYVYDEEACIYQIFDFTAATDKTVSVVIANRGNSTQALRARVKCMKSTGSYGSPVYSNNTVNLNNTYPSISIGSVTYPASQQALKNSETATVANTVTSFNTIAYSSANGNLSITNSTTYEASKTVTRIGGTYNVSTNNFAISATRTANAATTTNSSGLVYIANVLPTITVSVPSARLRSGGNDGTSAQSYVVTISSNQLLLSSPVPSLDLGVGGGIWLGGSFAGSGATWTRSVQITDNMTKGNYSFINLSVYNLANSQQTTINSGSAYELGGFVIRTLNLAAFANTTVMNVAVITYPSKVAMYWTIKSLPTKAAVGTVAPPPVSGAWCISALNTNPTTITILDTEATSSSSQLTTLTIEETV